VTKVSGRASIPILALLTALAPVGLHMFIPSLPQMARDLAVSPGSIQSMVTFYVCGMAVGQLVYGPLSDRYGRRPMMMAGMTLYAAGMIAAAFAPNGGVLIALRVAQALGGCGGLVLARAMIRDSSTPAGAAGQLALMNLAMSIAPAIAPAIGGYMTVLFGWRAIFGLLGALGMAGLLLIVLRVPETHHNRTHVTSVAALFGSFRRLLGNRAFVAYAIGGACTTTSIYAFVSVSPFLFIDLLHRPPDEVGFYYILLVGGVSVGSIAANRLSGRLPMVQIARLGSAVSLVAAAAFLVPAATGTLGVWSMMAPMAVYAAATGIAAPNTISGAMSANPALIGAAAGLYGFIQMSFGALCTVLVAVWHDGTALPVASLLLASGIAGQVALFTVARSRSP
jgi:DHA1 family bicyclomycin/chloramphenicol resistance-like MFS transporter